MKITILGSGTAAPRSNRNMSGYLFNKDMLFDTGPGTIRQLLKLKVNLLDINHIFYTHFHNDHISDLPAIIWSNNYGNFRKKPLNLYGPKGFKKYFNTLVKTILQLKNKDISFKINIKELKPKSSIKIKNIKIKSFKTKHTYNSVAYRIESKGKVLTYSGDTGYCKGIIDAGKNADLLILECSFPKEMNNHLTPALAGKVANKANAKKLVLTHFYPEVEKLNVKKLCGKEFDGKIVLAKDFMKNYI
jgi:ribonuclease BN (tRNA processing enzyme)